MTYTLVSFHAHPDDEAMLTGGTLARAAAEGHRVVLVTATNGEAGLTSPDLMRAGGLGTVRLGELQDAATALGVHRVVALGFPDGGFDAVDVQRAGRRLAEVLLEERADALTTYDRAGGYGHPDHVHVHRVGIAAARLAGTPVVLEATIDRKLLLNAVRLIRFLPGAPRVSSEDFLQAYSDRSQITHRVDVRPYLSAKKSALAAHRSQSVGGSARTVRFLTALPSAAMRPVLGHEWFIERGRPAGAELNDDIFASLR
jgi:LmbE family N-acetylglucosaminyl deacetylase